MDEFDVLGEEAFLKKYGFGHAREYFVRRDNRLYDSKAVVGAAYGYQFPDQGPLKSADFSGGESTVQRKLEELGFEVVVVRKAPPISVDASVPSGANLEKAFHARMIEVYSAAKEIGYNATRFLGMVSEHGGLETARMLLNASQVSEGYIALWERQHLELTVEAVIMEDHWFPLFTNAERRVAIRRLRDYGYSRPLPEV
jgi:hypothetical protein